MNEAKARPRGGGGLFQIIIFSQFPTDHRGHRTYKLWTIGLPMIMPDDEILWYRCNMRALYLGGRLVFHVCFFHKTLSVTVIPRYTRLLWWPWTTTARYGLFFFFLPILLIRRCTAAKPTLSIIINSHHVHWAQK